MSDLFEKQYKALNKGQKQAVDTIEGPVMVIAGPGTGKTQVITLRIGNILKSTDTPPDGVLALTFTNSGVSAMQKRLREYIGSSASRVQISTFHAFGTRLIEEFYQALDLPAAPTMLDDADAVSLVDRVLSEHDWTHIRPRSNSAMYFRDLKSLVSLLIRERMSPEDFKKEIERDIKNLENDPENISSRGPSKGQLKKEVQGKIESLEKTKEAVEFYRLYEEAKKDENVFDYDDILRSMVRLVTESEEARDSVRERYLYVLVDEHQDSSGIQNEFLKAVWSDVEKPNLFVVGDDRQLIYGFSGASLSHFEEFIETFRGTKLITLTENYRSTQVILDAADTLLESSLAKGKLTANRSDDRPIEIVEAAYPRDEIFAAGYFFRARIAEGLSPDDCALLVPKNSYARSAARMLLDMGLPVTSPGSLRLFETSEFRSFVHILKIIQNPFSNVDIAESILDPLSCVPALEAHRFLHNVYTRELSIEHLLKEGEKAGLFKEASPLYDWGSKLKTAIDVSKGKSVYEIVQYIGSAFFLEKSNEHEDFVRRVEIVRSLLHLALSLEEKDAEATIGSFLEYIDRLREYGEDRPLAVFAGEKGIRVMTLHASKGLEFEAVWIAHMNERALMSGKRGNISLPEKLKIIEEKKDEAAARREVYVAITRAKRFCTLSYALQSHKGADERIAAVVDMMPKENFIITHSAATEALLLAAGPARYVVSERNENASVTREELRELVKEKYSAKKVSATILNSFYDCPWKWYFRCFLDAPQPLPESLVFGSIVHAVIEYMLKLPHTPTTKDIDTAISKAIEDEHVIDKGRISRMTKDAKKALSQFIKTLLPELYEHRESERPLSYKDPAFPELIITGKIDLIESDGGENARVTDFKTGRARKANEIEKRDDEERMSSYLRQLAMYSYLLNRAIKGRMTVEKSRLYFVEETDPKLALYETYIGNEEIESLLKDIKDYDELLKSGEWTERECHFTPRPGEPECIYCKKAGMYK